MSIVNTGDVFVKMARSPAAKGIMKRVGLPTPISLKRPYDVADLSGTRVQYVGDGFLRDGVETAVATLGGSSVEGMGEGDPRSRFCGVVDAFALDSEDAVKSLFEECQTLAREVPNHSRIVVVSKSPDHCDTAMSAANAQGVRVFVKSLAKELGKRGVCVNGLTLTPEVAAHPSVLADVLPSPLNFFSGPRSAFVTGQSLSLSAPAAVEAARTEAPLELAGKVALVTGAARGIGAAIAQRLSDDGASVVAVDVPSAGDALERLQQRGHAVAHAGIDVTSDSAAGEITELLRSEFGGVDIVVHNAGITRDRGLVRMTDAQRDAVLNVNLYAALRIDEALTAHDHGVESDESSVTAVLRPHARIVALSSINGIGGAAGQTNYGFTKSALIGYAKHASVAAARRGATINCIAPGFIETDMTAKLGFLLREMGRRTNALNQGGLPEDVAAAIAALVQPGACGVTGQVLRVCGEHMVGQ